MKIKMTFRASGSRRGHRGFVPALLVLATTSCWGQRYFVQRDRWNFNAVRGCVCTVRIEQCCFPLQTGEWTRSEPGWGDASERLVFCSNQLHVESQRSRHRGSWRSGKPRTGPTQFTAGGDRGSVALFPLAAQPDSSVPFRGKRLRVAAQFCCLCGNRMKVAAF